MSQTQIAAERLYLTEDKTALVGEGDGRAATLYAAVGDEIPASAADQFGLVDGKLPAKKTAKVEPKPAAPPASKPAKAPASKPAKAPASKEKAPAETKPAGPAEKKDA